MVFICFFNLKGVSIWCEVISYKFVSKISISLSITPALAADDVPSHIVPLCPDWTEQGLHKGLSNIREHETPARIHKVLQNNPTKVNSPRSCCSLQVHIATPRTPQVLLVPV